MDQREPFQDREAARRRRLRVRVSGEGDRRRRFVRWRFGVESQGSSSSLRLVLLPIISLRIMIDDLIVLDLHCYIDWIRSDAYD